MTVNQQKKKKKEEEAGSLLSCVCELMKRIAFELQFAITSLLFFHTHFFFTSIKQIFHICHSTVFQLIEPYRKIIKSI